MRRAATKVAVSLPTTLFRSLERARRQRGRTRSAAVQEAVRDWLQRQREAALTARYEAGYRAQPESRREIRASEATSAEVLASQDW